MQTTHKWMIHPKSSSATPLTSYGSTTSDDQVLYSHLLIKTKIPCMSKAIVPNPRALEVHQRPINNDLINKSYYSQRPCSLSDFTSVNSRDVHSTRISNLDPSRVTSSQSHFGGLADVIRLQSKPVPGSTHRMFNERAFI